MFQNCATCVSALWNSILLRSSIEFSTAHALIYNLIYVCTNFHDKATYANSFVPLVFTIFIDVIDDCHQSVNILFTKYECMDHWGYSKKNGKTSYFSNFWYSLYYQIIFILKIMFIIFLVLERIYAGIIRNVLFRLIIA